MVAGVAEAPWLARLQRPYTDTKSVPVTRVDLRFGEDVAEIVATGGGVDVAVQHARRLLASEGAGRQVESGALIVRGVERMRLETVLDEQVVWQPALVVELRASAFAGRRPRLHLAKEQLLGCCTLMRLYDSSESTIRRS